MWKHIRVLTFNISKLIKNYKKREVLFTDLFYEGEMKSTKPNEKILKINCRIYSFLKYNLAEHQYFTILNCECKQV